MTEEQIDADAVEEEIAEEGETIGEAVDDVTSDERTLNPTEISDVTQLHPDEFAQLLDDLTEFQIQVLLAIQNLSITGQECYGLAIKRQLEEMYKTEEVHHGRLYPNLDQLRDSDLINKKPIDDRSNSYQLTPRGKGFLKKYALHTLALINGEDYSEAILK